MFFSKSQSVFAALFGGRPDGPPNEQTKLKLSSPILKKTFFFEKKKKKKKKKKKV